LRENHAELRFCVGGVLGQELRRPRKGAEAEDYLGQTINAYEPKEHIDVAYRHVHGRQL